VETQLLLSHLEKLSSAAMASDLSPGAQSVTIDQLLVDISLLFFFRQFGAQKPSFSHAAPNSLGLRILRHFRHLLAVRCVLSKF
jgi:hypothetical protein